MSYPAKILLIKLVKQHESVWNTRSPDYSRTDVKTRAWIEIAEQMGANGFESEVGRLKVMWKNLRDQWKRNIALKMPPEREWYFQRRINFLADTYEGGVRAHCPQYDMESPNGSPYGMKTEDFDYLADDYAVEGSSLMGDYSPAPIREPKSEMRDDGSACGPTLVTVLEKNFGQAAATVKEGTSVKRYEETPGISIVSSAALAAPPSAKRPRTEASNGGHIQTAAKSFKENNPSAEEFNPAPRLYQRTTPLSRAEAASAACTPKQREKIETLAKALKAGKSAPNDSTETQPPQAQNVKTPGDKFDKYAAFVSTTLREMPEMEAKRRMQKVIAMNVLGPGPTISDVGKLKLIEFVREQESIWNPKCPEYSKLDLKCAAWEHVQKQMKSEGFDLTLNFLRRVWNNLLVYWKKNLRYNKRAPGKEWSFGKSLNFLTMRYGSAYPHATLPRKPSRESMQRYPGDDDVKAEVDMSDEDWQPGTSADSPSFFEDDSLNGTDIEAESVPEPSYTWRGMVSRAKFHDDFIEQQMGKQCDQSSITNTCDEGYSSSTADKFDKYAAFLSSALREMPEKESKKKMKGMMFILLEDVNRAP
ncbi:hypothetical protein GCK32_010920 [Trichostrongylus colubriformis]|uniref:MADF domain-containing protein n=1 Tax=Trichostrongylus colubriformis TaxID=6319 RepID=A0AAN8ID28_TRICO